MGVHYSGLMLFIIVVCSDRFAGKLTPLCLG